MLIALVILDVGCVFVAAALDKKLSTHDITSVLVRRVELSQQATDFLRLELVVLVQVVEVEESAQLADILARVGITD